MWGWVKAHPLGCIFSTKKSDFGVADKRLPPVPAHSSASDPSTHPLTFRPFQKHTPMAAHTTDGRFVHWSLFLSRFWRAAAPPHEAMLPIVSTPEPPAEALVALEGCSTPEDQTIKVRTSGERSKGDVQPRALDLDSSGSSCGKRKTAMRCPAFFLIADLLLLLLDDTCVSFLSRTSDAREKLISVIWCSYFGAQSWILCVGEPCPALVPV